MNKNIIKCFISKCYIFFFINQFLIIFTKGAPISAHLFCCESFAVGNYSAGWRIRRLTSAPNLAHELYRLKRFNSNLQNIYFLDLIFGNNVVQILALNL